MQDMIARGNIPSAIFAADDVIALGVIRALKEAGYNVPDDVSVIGYDDQSFAGKFILHSRPSVNRRI